MQAAICKFRYHQRARSSTVIKFCIGPFCRPVNVRGWESFKVESSNQNGWNYQSSITGNGRFDSVQPLQVPRLIVGIPGGASPSPFYLSSFGSRRLRTGSTDMTRSCLQLLSCIGTQMAKTAQQKFHHHCLHFKSFFLFTLYWF